MNARFFRDGFARVGRLALFALGWVVFAGCASTPPGVAGPERGPLNVRAAERWPEELVRVAVLPAHDASGRLTPEFVEGHDAAWARALAQTHRAEWVRLERAQLAGWTGRATLSPTEPLPADFIGRVAARTGAQAVLFLELTQVSPYPPLVLAFRARLTAVESGETLWAVDEIFDARDPATARAARVGAKARAVGPGDAAHAVLQSPARFADHAFGTVAVSLPPRLAAPAEQMAEDAAKKSSALPAKRYPVRADSSR